MRMLKRTIALSFALAMLSAGSWLFVPNGSFSPDSIPGMQFWFKYDAVQKTGATINKWTDKSSNHRDLVFDSGLEATFSAGTGINGTDCIHFGTSSGGPFESSGTDIFDPAVGFAMVSVLHGETANLFPYFGNFVHDSTHEFRSQVVPSLPGYLQLTSSIIGASTIGVGLNNYYDSYYKTAHYLIQQFKGGSADDPANWVFTINGVDKTVNTDLNALTTPIHMNNVGAPTAQGADFGPIGCWGEDIFYNHPFTTQQKSDIEGYLNGVYAL